MDSAGAQSDILNKMSDRYHELATEAGNAQGALAEFLNHIPKVYKEFQTLGYEVMKTAGAFGNFDQISACALVRKGRRNYYKTMEQLT